MSRQAPKYAIIMAGGKGSRMRSSDRHKTCFLIDGKPAINHAIETYSSCGITRHVVVVGAMAEQVMETVSRQFAGTMFAYQPEQLGTADAARKGAEILAHLDDGQGVLVVAGDKIIESSALEKLINLFVAEDCDLAFLIRKKGDDVGLGRILMNSAGGVTANVEARDIHQRRIYRWIHEAAEAGNPPSKQEISREIAAVFNKERAAKAFGELWDRMQETESALSANELLGLVPPEMTVFEFAGDAGGFTPEEAESTPFVNQSVYLIRLGALRYALPRLDSSNAQQEEYLPDIITLLASHPDYQVRSLLLGDPFQVMGFNDPEELLRIEEHIQSRKQARMSPALAPSPAFRSIPQWRESFEKLKAGDRDHDQQLWNELGSIYGGDEQTLRGRMDAYLSVLDHAGRRFRQDEGVLIVRSPGRVNLLGRHIDHQGGNCNLMTIGYETIIVAHPRQDDRILLHNTDSERFPDRDFRIGDLIADLPWDDWLSLVNSDTVSQMVSLAKGDWSQYVKAACIRLQKRFAATRLFGADMVIQGEIPIAAGLSSSSALLVGAVEAMVAINKLDTFPSQLVDLCGEGEWFVGTRGGSADHAAIKLGQKGKVVKVRFFEFSVEKTVPFPDNHVLVVCDSGIKAQKTQDARDQFNQRITCYRIGFLLIKQLFPQYAPILHHLRDVNVDNLGVPLSWIYKILLRLPEAATHEELKAMLSEEDLDRAFSVYNPDGLYPIRGVVLFGLAESQRSRLYADLLEQDRLEEIGELMRISHDGDRVSRSDEGGNSSAFQAPTSNTALLDLIDDLESGEPERVVRAQLEKQPGSYHCSIPEIDRMVDISVRCDGVIGAQLAGAGLGGCMMVLIRTDGVDGLTRALAEGYYGPAGREPVILTCRPIAGSDMLLSETLEI